MKLQYTLFCTNGKYRPISTVIEVKSMADYRKHKIDYNKKAILNILHNKKMTFYNLKQYQYNNYKIREYKTEEEKEKEKNINLIKSIIKKRIKNKEEKE